MAINTCTVTGNVKDLINAAIENVTIEVNITEPFYHSDGTFIPAQKTTTTTDSSGDFSIDVIETATIGRSATFTFIYLDGDSNRKRQSYAVVVPDQASAPLSSLVGVVTDPITTPTYPASQVSVVSTGNLTSTDAQAALVELQTDIDTINANAVVGPASATDNAVARFDTTTGKLVQDSGVLIDDSNNMTGLNDVTMGGKLTVTGGIDPAYLQLDPQAGDSGIPNNSIFVDSNDSNEYKFKNNSGVSDSLVLDASFTAHTGASSSVHGVAGSVVGTSDAQTLTNKTIAAASNTISGLTHGTEVDDPSTGVHGVTSTIVGTTDTQTLQNKTFNFNQNTFNVNSNFVPDASNTRDLGAISLNWRRLYVDEVSLRDFGNNFEFGKLTADAGTLPSGAGAHFCLVQTEDNSTESGQSLGMFTTNSAVSNANTTGNVYLETGNKTAGTGDSGDILLKTGTSTGGTRGKVTLNAEEIELVANTFTGFPGSGGSSALLKTDLLDTTVTVLPTGSSVTVDGVTGTNGDLVIFTNLDPINEIQQISFSGTPTSGSFILRHDGNDTALLAFDASAGTIEAALEGLASITSVSVTGTAVAGPIVITFDGADSGIDFTQITVPTSTLQIDTIAGDETFRAQYNNGAADFDADSSLASLTGTVISGAPTITSNRAVFIPDVSSPFDSIINYASTSGVDPGNIGTVRQKITLNTSPSALPQFVWALFNGTNFNHAVLLSISTSNVLSLTLFDSVGGVESTTAGGTLTVGVEHEVEVSWDKNGAGDFRIFVDGTLTGSTLSTPVTSRTAQAALNIGTLASGVFEALDADIDDVQIFNTIKHTSGYTPANPAATTVNATPTTTQTGAGFPNNKQYLLGGVGSSITWTPQTAFSGSDTPTDGDITSILQGDVNKDRIVLFDASNWTIPNGGAVDQVNGTANNVGLSAAFVTGGGNGVTISLKQKDGVTDPAPGAGKVSVQIPTNGDATTATSETIEFTAPASAFIPNTSDLGLDNPNTPQVMFVYAIKDPNSPYPGEASLAVSGYWFEPGQSVTASPLLAGTSNNIETMYKTGPSITNAVHFKLIGIVKFTYVGTDIGNSTAITVNTDVGNGAAVQSGEYTITGTAVTNISGSSNLSTTMVFARNGNVINGSFRTSDVDFSVASTFSQYDIGLPVTGRLMGNGSINGVAQIRNRRGHFEVEFAGGGKQNVLGVTGLPDGFTAGASCYGSFTYRIK